MTTLTSNIGKPGKLYILDNPVLSPVFYKIGQTSGSGVSVANVLNDNGATGMPGLYKCIFELETKDCDAAEKIVYEKLEEFCHGKKGQEFFNLEGENLTFAKRVIQDVCREIDEKIFQDELRKQAEAKTKTLAEQKAKEQIKRKVKALAIAKKTSSFDENKGQEGALTDETLNTGNDRKVELVHIPKASPKEVAEALAQLREKRNSPKRVISRADIDKPRHLALFKKYFFACVIGGGILFFVIYNPPEIDKFLHQPASQTNESALPKPIETAQPKHQPEVRNGKYVSIYNGCDEKISVAFAYFDNTKLFVKSWWLVKPVSQITTNLMLHSKNVYAYAYSQNNLWGGNKENGLVAFIDNMPPLSSKKNHIGRNTTSLNAVFRPMTVIESENTYQVSFACNTPPEVTANKQIININKLKDVSSSSDSIDIKEYNLDLDQQAEIIRLKEEAEKLRITAYEKELEHQMLLESPESIKNEAPAQTSAGEQSNTSSSEQTDKSALIIEELRNKERASRYRRNQQEQNRNDRFRRLDSFTR